MKIGEVFVEKGIITAQQLETALKETKKSGEIVGKTLVRLGFITQEKLLEALAEQLCLVFYRSLKDVPINSEAVKAVPVKLIWHYKFMPIDLKNNVLTIAVSDPLAVWPMEDLKLHLGFDIDRVLASEKEIGDAIRRYYGLGAETVDEILTQDKTVIQRHKVEEVEAADMEKSAQDASVIKLVNQILTEAVNSRTTDIHMEPYRDSVRVRYRIDGVLYDMRVPEQLKYLHPAVVSRIKIISKQIDLRISIIPSLYGENVVIRILPVHLLFNLDDLGLAPDDLSKMNIMMQKPHGIIFLTGPTGSGKTTTLYACLSKLNKEGIKIITIEDPIEYELPGILQIQVKPEIGMTFANALRSILRHDPDIMMVGEVRDLETAELAIRTSLTGHLIFSTLHTNDSASGATRLLDIGIEPYLVASSVNAFISQRLVRNICPVCKEERKSKEILPDCFKDIKIYQGKGCENCKFIGYKGRSAIYEIFMVTEEIQELILNKSSAAQIKKKAQGLGFKTLLNSGIERVKQGLTTPEEVLRIVES